MEIVHPFLPNSVKTIEKEMLADIGADSIEDLFSDIPEKVRLKKALNIPGPYSELEVEERVRRILGRDLSGRETSVFLGGGVWPHYVPAAVQELSRRSEFLTSYTPYQPEISQGMLQALFEYQSLIVELTEMEYANCSMYDWPSALGEAALMAYRVTQRREILVPHYIGPERRETLRTYIQPSGMSYIEVANRQDSGLLEMQDLKRKLTPDTAAVYLEVPSFLGILETQVDEISRAAHENGSLLIVGADPISLGVIRPPGDYGADIVIGEGQPLGLGMNYGGPLLGIFACSGERLLRQLPGRIIGCTTTLKGDRRAFCMALQTREQHIRREKATSNICTNNALCAVAAAVYLSLLGPLGLKTLGETILAKVDYALKRLGDVPGVEAPYFKANHFKEFTVKFQETSLEDVKRKMSAQRIQGGIRLEESFPELRNVMLLCVTEMHSREDVERLAEALASAQRG